MQISVFYHHILIASEQTGQSLDDILQQVHTYGISAVEIDVDQVQPDTPTIKAHLDQAHLSVACMYGFFDFGHQLNAEVGLQFIDTAVALGASKVLVIPGFIELSASTEERQTALTNMVNVLNTMCDYAAQYNILVTMEDFDDQLAPFATSDELLWFLKHVPQLGCTFDTGNFIYSGEDVLDAFEKLQSRIVHVHCKDRSIEASNQGTPKITLDGTALFPSPAGAGCIPLKSILQKLQENGYQDTVAIEHFDAVDQLSYIKQSAQWLQTALGRTL